MDGLRYLTIVINEVINKNSLQARIDLYTVCNFRNNTLKQNIETKFNHIAFNTLDEVFNLEKPQGKTTTSNGYGHFFFLNNCRFTVQFGSLDHLQSRHMKFSSTFLPVLFILEEMVFLQGMTTHILLKWSTITS